MTLFSGRSRRSERGGMLVLMLAVLPCVLLLLMATLHIGMLCLKKARMQNAADAVALAAANDLAKIVISDPHFGFVSLSDCVPVGRATVAGDGQATPVLGINTIVGTARLDLLIATNSGDPFLIQAAQDECFCAKQTVSRLNAALAAALAAPGSATTSLDLDGNFVVPIKTARSVLRQNFAEWKDNGLTLKLGSTNAGFATITPAAQPTALAQTSDASVSAGFYRTSVNVPAEGQDFYFAALSKNPLLTAPSAFVTADSVHPSSVVLVTLQDDDADDVLPWLKQNLTAQSAALPGANQNILPPGMLIVWNSIDDATSLLSLNNLMNNTTGTGAVSLASAGDYPGDANSVLTQTGSSSTGVYLSKAVLDWLRNARLTPRIDSAKQLINQPIDTAYKLSVYDFSPDGSAFIFHPGQSPFVEQKVSDEQSSYSSADALGDGSNYNLVCHNQVVNMGTTSGGKHAGQPIPGDPINWMELPAFNNGQSLDALTGTGNQNMAVAVAGASGDCQTPGINLVSTAVSSSAAIFFNSNGAALAAQPRKTYYAGGEAVYVQISKTSFEH